ncbi:MAG TPA: hypothetical protein VIY96_09635, partial [Thermoanaerobaculia bacterium]
VEHHLEFLAASDWIIDLGPGGGDEGGRIVAEGSPDEIRRSHASLTGRFLASFSAADEPPRFGPRARPEPRTGSES